MLQEALHAFKRAFILDPNNTAALSYIGYIQLNQCIQDKSLNSAQKLETKSNAMCCLKQVHEKSGRRNPGVELVMADIAFGDKKFELAGRMSRKILEMGNRIGKNMRVIALLHVGQIHQINKEFDQAYDCYKNILRLDPTCLLALFLCGQVEINKSHYFILIN